MWNRTCLILILVAPLAGCAGGEVAGRAPSEISDPIYRAENSPLFTTSADREGGAPAIVTADAAARFARGLDPDGRGVERMEIAAAPILFGSPEGRAFLAATGPRAFAIGEPEESCPARAAGVGESPAAAAEAALDGCRARLDAARPGGAGDCGCLLLALGDYLLAPPGALSYASGVSARLVAPDLEEERYLVAEERPGENGARIIAFRGAPGGPDDSLLIATITPQGEASLLWRPNGPGGDATRFAGRRIADGLRRGRYAERLYLEDEAGRRMTLLVGYEPVEYAVRRRELLSWPRG